MDYQEIVNQAIQAGNIEVATTAINAASSVASSTAIAKGMLILSMMGSAFGESFAVVSAFNAIGRNPKLEETLFSKVIISVALIESTAIYAFVAFFLI